MTLALQQTITAGSGGASSFSFQNIPQTAKDLLLVISHRGDPNSQATMTVNNDSTNVYRIIYARGPGANPISNFAFTAQPYVIATSIQDSSTAANTFGVSKIYITNYTATQNKAILLEGVGEDNSATAYIVFGSQDYNGGTAVSRLDVSLTSFVQHSTASLYLIS